MYITHTCVLTHDKYKVHALVWGTYQYKPWDFVDSKSNGNEFMYMYHAHTQLIPVPYLQLFSLSNFFLSYQNLIFLSSTALKRRIPRYISLMEEGAMKVFTK